MVFAIVSFYKASLGLEQTPCSFLVAQPKASANLLCASFSYYLLISFLFACVKALKFFSLVFTPSLYLCTLET